MFDDVPTADDADEDFTVIDDRYEVLLHGGFDQLFHGTVDIDRLVMPSFRQCADADIFGAFQVQRSMAFDVAKQVALSEGTDLHALFVENGKGGVAVVLHLFQCLAQGAVFGDKGNVLFGR